MPLRKLRKGTPVNPFTWIDPDLGFQQLTVSHSDKPRRRAPQARRTARSAGWARGKGAGSHRRSAVWAGAAGSASVAGKFSDETTKLTGEPGLREVPAEGCGHAS